VGERSASCCGRESEQGRVGEGEGRKSGGDGLREGVSLPRRDTLLEIEMGEGMKRGLFLAEELWKDRQCDEAASKRGEG